MADSISFAQRNETYRQRPRGTHSKSESQKLHFEGTLLAISFHGVKHENPTSWRRKAEAVTDVDAAEEGRERGNPFVASSLQFVVHVKRPIRRESL